MIPRPVYNTVIRYLKKVSNALLEEVKQQTKVGKAYGKLQDKIEISHAFGKTRSSLSDPTYFEDVDKW